jgi:hypothetical protein
LEHHPRLDRGVAIEVSAEAGSKFGSKALGDEAEPAVIDAQYGSTAIRTEVGGANQSAVAAEGHDEVALGEIVISDGWQF